MHRSGVFSGRSFEFSDMFDFVRLVDWKLHGCVRLVGNLYGVGYDECGERLIGDGHLRCHSDDAYFESYAGCFRDRRYGFRVELCGDDVYSLVFAGWALQFSGMLDLRNGYALWKLHGRVNCGSWHLYGYGYNGRCDRHNNGVVHRAFANPYIGSVLSCCWERGRSFRLGLSGHDMFSVSFAVRPLHNIVMFHLGWHVEWRFHGCVRRVRNVHRDGYDERRERISVGYVHCYSASGWPNSHLESGIRLAWDVRHTFRPALHGHDVYSIVFAVRPLHLGVMLDLGWHDGWKLHGRVKRGCWGLHSDYYDERFG
jgi:hypothetical protein